MKKDLTLLVLAAGMGSRFGGLKQIEPVGPNGEFIIDYSVYDAIMAGFTKVVFVIKEENYEIFKSTIGARIENKIKVEYAFQKLTDVPEGVIIPEDRVKPLGTAQAIYAARDLIHENFAIINADDFYGRDGYIKAAEFLRTCEDDEYANIAYEVGNTISENGAVKRGVIFEENGVITNLVESSIEKVNGKLIATPLSGDKEFEVEMDTPVSMNLFCFTPAIFEYIKNNIKDFFLSQTDLMKCEYLIPTVAKESSKYNNKPIKFYKTNSKYYGMTYREDLEELKNGILKEIESGTYKKDLWS
jgi:NDP-sugar pyrophosphorylase family protein